MAKAPKGINIHIYTNDIICPYCGDKIDDTDYICDNIMEGRIFCDKCNNEFEFYANTKIVWVTSKIESNENKLE